MRRLWPLLLGFVLLGPVRADEDLEALWKEACLWEVGSNAEKVPAARNRLIAAGEKALDLLVPAKLDTADGLVARGIQTVLGGLAKPENAALRRKTIDRLIPCLGSEHANVRRNAAEVLGQVGAVEAAPAIAKLLDDKDARLGALRALGGLKQESTVPAVVALLESQSLERHRVEAAVTLAGIGGDAAREALLRALAAPTAPVRFAAQFGLEKLKAVDALRAKLADPARTVRLHAIWALGRLGDTTARADLMARLDDPDPVVRGFAAGAVTPMLGPADHDDVRKRLAAETHPFAKGKLAAALEQTDRP